MAPHHILDTYMPNIPYIIFLRPKRYYERMKTKEKEKRKRKETA